MYQTNKKKTLPHSKRGGVLLSSICHQCPSSLSLLSLSIVVVVVPLHCCPSVIGVIGIGLALSSGIVVRCWCCCPSLSFSWLFLSIVVPLLLVALVLAWCWCHRLALALASIVGGVGVGIHCGPFVGCSSPSPSTPQAVAHSRGVGSVIQDGTHYHPAGRGSQRWWVGAKQMAMGAVSLLKHS